jgi:hypothetical protein
MEPVSTIGEELLEERRRRRRAGDPRLNEQDRAILRRVTGGDLAEEFQAALDADLAADPLLGGHADPDDTDAA